jgi:hypothetical protein
MAVVVRAGALQVILAVQATRQFEMSLMQCVVIPEYPYDGSSVQLSISFIMPAAAAAGASDPVIGLPATI